MTEAGLGSVMTSKIYLRGIPYVQSLWVASDVSPFSYQRLAQVGVLNVRSFVDNGISDAGANDRCMPCDADVGAYDGVLDYGGSLYVHGSYEHRVLCLGFLGATVIVRTTNLAPLFTINCRASAR